MSHEIETMMWLNNPPWHSLGTEITEDDSYSIEKCIVTAGLNWRVGLEQCFINVDYKKYGTMGWKPVDAYATVREKDLTVLGIVGERYEILQNIEAFKIFQPFLDSKLARLNTAGSLHDGKRIWILAEIVGDPIEIRPNDFIKKFILLSHSHDGMSPIRFGLTPVRVVCSNTLAMAHNDKGSQLFKVKHTQNMHQNLENIRDVIETINNDYTLAAKQYKTINDVIIDKDQLDRYVKDVFGINGEKISTRTYNILEKVKSYFEHAPGNQGRTLWDAYNSVSYYLSHDYGNNVDNRLSSLWFGKSAELNKKALQLALEMTSFR